MSGLGGAVRGALLQPVAEGLLRRTTGSVRWSRTNHRHAEVSLVEGPAVALALGACALLAGGPRVAVAGGLAVAAAGLAGVHDDLAGSDPTTSGDKGFGGHLAALRQGRLTTGAVKVVGISAAGLAAAAVLHRGRDASLLDLALDGALVAGAANLVNLLDLRPGRALKVAALLAPLAGGPLSGPTLGVVAAALPGDLAERTMLGDAGANALGALLGVSAVAARPVAARRAALGVVLALTAASEQVSFTRVIESTPALAALDALGRRR